MSLRTLRDKAPSWDRSALNFVEPSRPSLRESGLLGDAAGGRRRRDSELPVYDLGANRGGPPSAVCLLAFCAGGLCGVQHQYGDERDEKARADAEPVAAKPHQTRMARGRSRRIGHPAHFQLWQVLSFDVLNAIGSHGPALKLPGFTFTKALIRKGLEAPG
jgi:hypothetical protein